MRKPKYIKNKPRPIKEGQKREVKNTWCSQGHFPPAATQPGKSTKERTEGKEGRTQQEQLRLQTFIKNRRTHVYKKTN